MSNYQVNFTVKYLIRCLLVFFISFAFILFFATSSSCNTAGKIDAVSNIPTDEKPTSPDDIKESKPSEVIIVIDAGHGGRDWGTHHGSMREKTINLDMALKLGPLLQKENIKIVYTREEDIFVDLKERADIANNINATLFISIHNNKMPENSKYNGTETLYSAASNSRFDTMTDKRLARIVQDMLVKDLKTSDKGIIYRPGLAVLRRTSMPAVIAEIGYISNSSDREKLSSNAFRQKTANALSKAVLKALEEMGAAKDPDGKWMVLGR